MLNLLDISEGIKYFLIGLMLITSIDILGAIASNKFNFKYAYLISLSVLIYVFVGFIISKWFNIEVTFFVCAILGLFDGSVGIRLAIILKANMNLQENQIKKLKSYKTALNMALIGGALGILGYCIQKLF